MAPPRRVFVEPNIPGAHPAARHDQRAFGQRYSPQVQLDELIPHDRRRQLLADQIDLPSAINRATAQILPPQLVQGMLLVQIPAFGAAGATLLIPKNPDRLAFTIANFTVANNILFSYDMPVDSGQGIAAGIPIGGCYQETNGTVSTNDIYVFCNDINETYPIWILGYQGQLSLPGNVKHGG